jgi:multidrug efflux system membrane fusion protein
MTTSPKKAPRRKLPAMLLVALVMGVLAFVIVQMDSAPRTDDAYAHAYADTIGVVPEVSGRIINLAVHDSQAVKAGDVLFLIDARPYEAVPARGQASLAALDQQIALTQRTVNAQ